MDLTTLNGGTLSSVFPHTDGDANAASQNLFGRMLPNISGQLIRISPSAFIYMSSVDNTDGTSSPVCHLVMSTDNDHYVGDLDYAGQDDSEDDEDDTSEIPTDDSLVSDDSMQNVDEGSCSSDISDDVIAPEDTTAPTDDQCNSVVVPVMGDPINTTIGDAHTIIGNADIEPATDTPDVEPEPQAQPEADVVPDNSDSVYTEYPNDNENLEESSSLLENVFRRKYDGHIIRHNAHSFTHVRRDGTIDYAKTEKGRHYIGSYRLRHRR